MSALAASSRPVLSLDQLAAQWETLRQEYEASRAQFADLQLRLKELDVRLHQMEAELKNYRTLEPAAAEGLSPGRTPPEGLPLRPLTGTPTPLPDLIAAMVREVEGRGPGSPTPAPGTIRGGKPARRARPAGWLVLLTVLGLGTALVLWLIR